MDFKYQVFVAYSNGWAWQGNDLGKALKAAARCAEKFGKPAYVVDTGHGGIIFTAGEGE